MSKDMKIAICFGLIMGALISFCNMCFAAEREEVTFSTIDNIAVNPSTNKLVTYSGSTLYYVTLEPGYKYYVTNTSSSARNIAFMNSIEVGADVSITSLGANVSISFDGSVQYLYVGDSATGWNPITIEREKLEGLPSFIDNVAYSLSYANLSGVLFFVVPLIAISVLFGLGFVLLGRIIKKMRNAKGGM